MSGSRRRGREYAGEVKIMELVNVKSLSTTELIKWMSFKDKTLADACRIEYFYRRKRAKRSKRALGAR